MRKWDDYKNYVKSIDEQAKEDLEIVENTAAIITAMIKQRTAMGISQRDLATLCDMSQSSVARIESYKVTPNLETIMKLLKPLGLRLAVAVAK